MGRILAGSALALPPAAPFGVAGWLGREAEEVTRLPLSSLSLLPSLFPLPSRLSEISSPSSYVLITEVDATVCHSVLNFFT